MNFIQKYFEKLACKHNWEVYNKTRIYRVNEYGRPIGEHPSGYEHTLCCTECGKWKKLKL